MSPLKKKLLDGLLNALLFCLSVAVMALLGEFVVRVTGLQPMDMRPQIHQASGVPGLVFELIPNLKDARGFGSETVSTDSRGFRSPEPDPGKPSVVFLGDSMTFGFGVADHQTNPAVFGTRFPEYNIINTGVASYNIEQEALTYRLKAKQFDPKLVVLQFVTNDAEAQSAFTSEGTAPRGADPAKDDAKLKEAITKKGLLNFPGKFFLEKNSALFRFIERRTKGLPLRAKSSMFGREWTDADYAYYEQWFTLLTREIGSRPKLFVLWPDGFLYPVMKARIISLAAEQGWTVLDLSDYFGIRYDTLVWDHHPRASVQAEAAGIIADTVTALKLLPAMR